MTPIKEEHAARGNDDHSGKGDVDSSAPSEPRQNAGHASYMAIANMVEEYEEPNDNEEDRLWTPPPVRHETCNALGTWNKTEIWGKTAQPADT